MVTTKRDVRKIRLFKGNERYDFVYDLRYTAELQRVFGRYAVRPDLSFTWYDAAVLTEKVREMR